ncbi:hypothetical protein N658DRAFT_504286 [Parathielavia hyrcaniae]|uniref:Uncharacterized protein n=1 Tax=Parathielavia hyrcaniae TaxID=113614 RepID=A0AAN6Q857_9PEZI|nr:hypothetical protein N658DRAFT_504286 [Parathielavia hyrcaniae]
MLARIRNLRLQLYYHLVDYLVGYLHHLDEYHHLSPPGGLGRLCSWACAHGYCPSPCTCTLGTPGALLPFTGSRGYALLDVQSEPGFALLCDFVCLYAADYCPEGVCTRVPYTTTPGGDGTACVQGVGEGGKAGLCSYSCRFGHCPAASGCTCTLYGQPIAEPPVLSTSGKPAPGITDEGFADLCAFTCNHGYCPPEVCVYASTTY